MISRLKNTNEILPLLAVLIFLIGGWCFAEWQSGIARFCKKILVRMDETPPYTRTADEKKDKKKEEPGPKTKWKGSAQAERHAGKILVAKEPFSGPPVLSETSDTSLLFIADSCLQTWAVRKTDGPENAWKNCTFTALNGDIDLTRLFPELKEKGGTVELRVRLRPAQPRTDIFFLFSFDGTLCVDLNGKPLHTASAPASFRRNSPFSAIADLPAGENEILLKSSGPAAKDRLLNIRLVDADSNPIYFEQGMR